MHLEQARISAQISEGSLLSLHRWWFTPTEELPTVHNFSGPGWKIH